MFFGRLGIAAACALFGSVVVGCVSARVTDGYDPVSDDRTEEHPAPVPADASPRAVDMLAERPAADGGAPPDADTAGIERTVAACGDGGASAGSADSGPMRPVRLLHTTVDLMVGESQTVQLTNGKRVAVRLIAVEETHDPYTNALLVARVRVAVDGEEASLTAATYNLPITVGAVQIDSPVVIGYVRNSSGTYGLGGLTKDARLRLWPAGSPLIAPGTFVYPVKQRWFAADSWISNEPITFTSTPRNSISYHSSADIGGCDELTELVSAVDGLVVGSSDDNVFIRSGPWTVRYFHMKTREVKEGDQVRMGQRIGLLGREGSSGGWAHVHFGIAGRVPSGVGEEQGYVFLWDAYMRQYGPPLVAVAGPLHHGLVEVGQSLTFEGGRSRSFGGQIVKYEWFFTDGETLIGPTVRKTYRTAGHHSEVLKVTDNQGRVEYDFVKVQAYDEATPNRTSPRLDANYHPSQGIQPGDPITFKVRAFNNGGVGEESWDFGDGSPRATTRSPNVTPNTAPGAYAQIVHRYAKPGNYLVRVERTNATGLKGTAHLHVAVGEPRACGR